MMCERSWLRRRVPVPHHPVDLPNRCTDRNQRARAINSWGAAPSLDVATGPIVGGNAITTGDCVESPDSQPANRSEQPGQHRLAAVRERGTTATR